MDNKNFPPLEPDRSLPDALPEIPERMEPLKEHPVIEELSFEQDAPATEAEAIKQEAVSPDLPEEEILLSAPGQSLIEIDEVDHTDRMLQVGKFVQTAGGFSVGSVHFDYSDIAYFDIVRHGFLLFTTVDKHYYQIKSTVHFPGLLAKMLWQRYGKKHK